MNTNAHTLSAHFLPAALEKTGHSYVQRSSGQVVTERLFGDRLVRFLYSRLREQAPWLFRTLTSQRTSDLLARLQFDSPLASHLLGSRRFLRSCGVELDECLDAPESLRTPRQIFERRIRYWESRPMEDDGEAVVSPADARVAVGTLQEGSALFLKEKFFSLEELVGRRKWAQVFREADYAVFRLTPEKYHYNHVPVAGRLVDFYELLGGYHSCHPAAIVEMAGPFSKNRRVVSILDTDVPGGTGVGYVAMVEVVALLIGEVVQSYSEERYDDPRPMAPGMTLCKGAVKSLYRPGSSTDVLLFEPGRIRFSADLVRHAGRADVTSLFTQAFDHPLVEVEVAVRSTVAHRVH